MKKVILLLRKGEVIVHNDRNYLVSDEYTTHKIQWRTWEKMTKQGQLLISQDFGPFFDWKLTELGKTIDI